MEAAWSLLPEPERPLPRQVVLEELNWFEVTPRFLRTREQRLSAVVGALRTILRSEPLESKVITTRYTVGLPSVERDSLRRLLEELEVFVSIADDG